MMPYFDATLAFALTMLAVATLVTQIVRLLKNTASVRQAGLKKMLEEFFAGEVQPVVKRELNRLKTTASQQVVTSLTEAVTKYTGSSELSAAQAEKLVDMTTDELLERLKRSELGEKLLSELGDHSYAIFTELGKRYEVVGKRATESFRHDSARWAFFVALVLAVVLNIDSIYIANTYVSNASLTQSVIVQKDAFVEDYNALAKTLETEQNKTDFTKADLEQAFKDSQDQLKVVTGSGFPLGWSYFPHAYILGKIQPAQGISQDFINRNHFSGWISWIAGVFLTAALAGRGGPFWYDVVAGVSRVVQSTRAAAKKPE